MTKRVALPARETHLHRPPTRGDFAADHVHAHATPANCETTAAVENPAWKMKSADFRLRERRVRSH